MKQRIPAFDDFLNESVKSVFQDPRVKELNKYLLLNNVRGCEDFMFNEIPKYWKVYDRILTPLRKDMMTASQCYDNALKFAKENPSYKLIAGAFIYWDMFSKDKKWMDADTENKFNPGYVLYPHAYNTTENNEVYDITLLNDRHDIIYIGEEVNPKDFKTGFGDLSKYVSKALNRKV